MNHSIGVIGLGVMGANIARNMANHGETVAVYNYTADLTNQLVEQLNEEAIYPFYTTQAFVQSLETPRKIFVMVTAGEAIDSVLHSLMPYLEKGDIIMDGGNSHYQDTKRRYDKLKSKNIAFIGVGISGGEVGALTGPAIMPGGDLDAYHQVSPILTKIAAQVNNQPCCAYIGPKGSGHFVKTVHNGIEYADMQLIAEAFTFLRDRLSLPLNEIATIFEEWNAGELNSYLIEITATILRKNDPITKAPLIDVILDNVGQKGTGMWTSMQAIKHGIPSSIMTESLVARYLSSLKEERLRAQKILVGPHIVQTELDKSSWVEYVRQALYMGKICAYAQGFTQYKMTSDKYDWNLPLDKIALIFRGGCVIRASFLTTISDIYQSQPNLANLLLDPYFANKTKYYQTGLRAIVGEGVKSGLAFPALSAAISYYDSYRTGYSNANLLQAQRDYFGAHTYERIDREGIFHTEWA